MRTMLVRFFFVACLVMPSLFIIGCCMKTLGDLFCISEKSGLADELHTKGLMLYDEGKYEEAIDTWLKEIEIAPKRAKPYNNIGLIYRKLGDFYSAIKFHEEAIKIDPASGHSHYSLGLVYYDLEDYKKAKELFLRAIELDYYNADVYYSLGQTYKQLADYENAIKAYENTIKLYYNFPGAHYQLGDTYRLIGNFDFARMELKREISINPCWELLSQIALLEIDIEIEPTNIDKLFVLGMLYQKVLDEKYLEKAVITFRKIIELNSSYPEVHFQLGQLYEMKGDFFMAEQEYLKEIEINPDHSDARQAIEKIKSNII